MRRAASVLAVVLLAAPILAFAAKLEDPLRSPNWDAMVSRHLDGGTVVFDERVQVRMPEAAEDPLSVPVEVSVQGLQGIEEIRVFADLNPIPLILSYTPRHADPGIGFRFKVEQSTPVRAAARTKDGVWHVGGTWLRASGGGCTAPSQTTGSGLWRDQLNTVSGAMWPRPEGKSRLKLRVMHPMDTGLAGAIPAFYIETLQVLDAQGEELASLRTYEPVSENPVLSLNLHHQGPVHIVGRDIQGNRIDARVAP